MPLLSIEFAVFFIVFLPLYWAFARLPQVQNVLLLVAGLGWLYRIDPIFAAVLGICTFATSSKRFTFGCRTGLALPYRPYLCRADFGLLVCGLPGQRADVF